MAPPPRAADPRLEGLARFLEACEEAAAAIRIVLAEPAAEDAAEARRRVDVALEAIRRARETLDLIDAKQAGLAE